MNINVFNIAQNEGFSNIRNSTCYRLSDIPNLVLGTRLRYSGPGTSEKFFTLNGQTMGNKSPRLIVSGLC